MPKLSKPKTKTKPATPAVVAPMFKVGDKVIFNNGPDVYEVTGLPVSGVNPWYELKMGASKYNAPAHLLSAAITAKDKADIEELRKTAQEVREDDGRLPKVEPEWVAKLITWNKAGNCGFIRLSNDDTCDLYLVRKEAERVFTWTRMDAHADGLNICRPYIVTVGKDLKAESCGCKGWKSHRNCKHARATSAVLSKGCI